MEEDWMPKVNEPMEEYLRSDRFRSQTSTITFSDFKGQEEANYNFWRMLTPKQRLELHQIMIASLYQDHEKNDGNNHSSNELIFTEPFQ